MVVVEVVGLDEDDEYYCVMYDQFVLAVIKMEGGTDHDLSALDKKKDVDKGTAAFSIVSLYVTHMLFSPRIR